MKPTNFRRYRRRHIAAKSDANIRKNESDTFFGEPSPSMFFPPAISAPLNHTVQRQAAAIEKEEPAVQARADNDKEDDKVMRATDERDEDKIQRRAKKEDDEKLDRKASDSNVPPSPSVGKYIGSLNGKGSTLPVTAQYFFGARMGHDFSKVRIHTDSEATASAKAINAKAYTVDGHIVFNEGQYNLETAEGKKLMAHELAHVIQQGKGLSAKIQCAPEGDEEAYTPTTDELVVIAAVVGAEAQVGQETDLAWVFYNSVRLRKDAAKGLKESHAYRARSNHFKLYSVLLGNTEYGGQKPMAGDELRPYKSFNEAIEKNPYYTDVAKPRLEKILQKLQSMFEGKEKGNTGFSSNSNLSDVNGNADWARELRQYLFLSDEGKVNGKYIKQIGSGKTWQVVYNGYRIEAYFRKHPEALPADVPDYKPGK